MLRTATSPRTSTLKLNGDGCLTKIVYFWFFFIWLYEESCPSAISDDDGFIGGIGDSLGVISQSRSK
jgi:hypothetical protein